MTHVIHFMRTSCRVNTSWNLVASYFEFETSLPVWRLQIVNPACLQHPRSLTFQNFRPPFCSSNHSLSLSLHTIILSNDGIKISKCLLWRLLPGVFINRYHQPASNVKLKVTFCASGIFFLEMFDLVSVTSISMQPSLVSKGSICLLMGEAWQDGSGMRSGMRCGFRNLMTGDTMELPLRRSWQLAVLPAPLRSLQNWSVAIPRRIWFRLHTRVKQRAAGVPVFRTIRVS